MGGRTDRYPDLHSDATISGSWLTEYVHTMSGSGGNSNAISRISGFDLSLLRVARSEEIVDRVFFFSQLVSGSSEEPKGDTDSDLISIHLHVRRECADSVDVQ